jgi:hypothetical protein
MDLHRIIYVSTAVEPFTEAELESIVVGARRKNAGLSITGELLYSGGTVMQVLEGEREAVESLFETIGSDLRHTFVVTVQSTPCESRLFSEWSMGLCNLDSAPAVSAEEFLAIQQFLLACPALDTNAVAQGIKRRFETLARNAA